MAEQIIKCPKCKKSKLLVSEAAEVHFFTMYEDGEFVGHTTEKTERIIRQFASCLNPDCKHEWSFRKQVDLTDIPVRETNSRLIEYVCVGCSKPRKMVVQPWSNFNPETDECPECEMGISDEC